MREGAMERGEFRALIVGVEPGRYRIVVRGEEPLQRYGVVVAVREGETANAVVRIEPIVVELKTSFGDAVLAQATVDLRNERGGWKATIRTDDNGKAEGELWQQGPFRAAVRSLPAVRVWTASKNISGEGRVRWDLPVPDRRIRGRALDAESGQPLAQAKVLLRSPTEDGQLLAPVMSDSSGRFEFTGVMPGEESLQVKKEGYQDNQEWRFQLASDEPIHEIDLPVQRVAAPRRLTVTTASGVPLPEVGIYLAQRTGVREIGLTDENGQIVLPLASTAERGVVFGLPRSGSFGFARLSGSDEPMTLSISDGSASLEIRAETESEKPIPNVPVIIRFNGMLMPGQVVEALSRLQGVRLQTDAQGRLFYPRLPPGHYEIWPVASHDDFLAVFSPTPPPAPVDLVVVPGLSSVRMKFQPK